MAIGFMSYIVEIISVFRLDAVTAAIWLVSFDIIFLGIFVEQWLVFLQFVITQPLFR
jgi:hypothetical protein